MTSSDIFDNFVKIALKKGLISESEHAEHTEKDFHETNQRMDSLTIEQISKLYNTKSDQPADMKYKHNIIEDAHPESLVIAPSYDKLNGLIENENEGQNIRINIVMKTPDGLLTQRKYAEKQLILSLVRTANELDSRNQDELCRLADVCLAQTTKPFKKTAIAPVVLGVAAIAAAIGAIYFKQHSKFHSDGFAVDYQKAVAEIDDLLNSNSNLGVGYTYTPTFIQTVNALKDKLGKLNTIVQKVMPTLEKIETPHTTQELKELATQPIVQDSSQGINELKEFMVNEYAFINKVISDFGDEGFKQRAIAEKGYFTSLVDSTDFLHGGKGIVADDFDDVRHALETVKADVENLVDGLRASSTAQQSFMQQANEAQSEVSETWNKSTPDAGETPEAGAAQSTFSPAEAVKNILQ